MGNALSFKNLGKFAKKGAIPWNKGKTGVQIVSEETRLKLSISHSNEKHWNWKDGSGKDNKVGYRALHSWIGRELGKSETCEHCKKTGFTEHQIHWANKDGEYQRNIIDWIRLCSKCHGEYDKKNKLRIRKSLKVNK